MLLSIFIGFLSLIILLLFTLFSKTCIPETQEAVVTFINTILPTMFPFYVLSSLISASSLLEKIFSPANKPITRLLKISDGCISAIILGFFCGFPIGSLITCNLKEKNKISNQDAQKLSAFTNNAGPIFMISIIGNTYLHSAKAGLLLWLSVLFSSVISGIIVCNLKITNNSSDYHINCISEKNETSKIDFPKTIQSSANTILYVGAVIIFFASVTSVIKLIPNISPCKYGAIYSFLEITGGLKSLIPALNFSNIIYKYMIISFFASWSGLCVHIQVCGILASGKIKLSYYFTGKLIQIFITPIICFILMSLFI